MLTAAALFGLLAPSLTLVQAPPEPPKPARPWIGDREDLAAVKRSWSVDVKLDGVEGTLEEIVAELSRRAGLAVKVEPGTVGEPNGEGSGVGYLEYSPVGRFLDIPGLSRVMAVTYEYAPGREKGTMRLKGNLPMPLGIALSVAARAFNLKVVHRPDGPVLGNPKTLLPELLSVQSHALRFGGREVMLRSGNLARKVTLEDAAAKMVLDCGYPYLDPEAWRLVHQSWTDESTNGWPAGAAAMLRGLGLGFDVRHDAARRVLLVTATADTHQHFRTRGHEIDQLEPAEAARRAVQFREDRLASLVRSTGAAATPGDHRLVARLADGGIAEREEAEGALAKRGLAGAAAILEDRAATDSDEFRARSKRVLARIYGEVELKEILARADAYLKAGMEGDLEAIRTDFWTERRRLQDDEARREFEELRDSAKGDPARWKTYLKSYGLPAATKPEDLSWDRGVQAGLAILEPRVERVRISGAGVEIRFSAKLPGGHPMAHLSREFGSRLASSFFMEFDGRAWRGGEEGPFSDHEALYWSSKEGWGGKVLETESKRSGVKRGENRVAGWVSSYVVGFGY